MCYPPEIFFPCAQELLIGVHGAGNLGLSSGLYACDGMLGNVLIFQESAVKTDYSVTLLRTKWLLPRRLDVFVAAKRQYRLQLHLDDLLAEAAWHDAPPAME